MLFPNHLRPRLRSGQPTFGMWVTLESPTVTEIAVAMRLDWIVIDTEHGHLDQRDVMEHLRAARGSETTPLVRLPDFHQDHLKRALDMGAHGVLLPLVRSAEDVEQGFRYGRYAPRGRRGIGGERAVQWGLAFQEYLAAANDETLIIPIIETREAVEDLDAILATEGLEALFIGPADLSASYGYVGEWEGPGVAERILEVVRKAAACGVAAGVMGRGLPEARTRVEQGFRMIGLGADAGLLIDALGGKLQALRGDSVERGGY